MPCLDGSSLSTASLSCNYGSPAIDLDALVLYSGKIVAIAEQRKTNAHFVHYCGTATVVFV